MPSFCFSSAWTSSTGPWADKETRRICIPAKARYFPTMNKFIRIALLGLATSIVSLNSGFAGGCGGCTDGDKKDKKESTEGEKKE